MLGPPLRNSSVYKCNTEIIFMIPLDVPDPVDFYLLLHALYINIAHDSPKASSKIIACFGLHYSCASSVLNNSGLFLNRAGLHISFHPELSQAQHISPFVLTAAKLLCQISTAMFDSPLIAWSYHLSLSCLHISCCPPLFSFLL